MGAEVTFVETKKVIAELRNKAGLSQEELAEKVFVTRQGMITWTPVPKGTAAFISVASGWGYMKASLVRGSPRC